MKNNNNVEIEYIAINDVMPYKNNPRNNKKAVAGVAESIQKFGFKVPVVVDANNVIVCGHTRYLASKKLGLEKIPCIRANDLTEEEIKAFRLADNKESEAAEWDLGKLAEELEEITIDMTSFGFEFDTFRELDFDEDTDIDEDVEDEGYYGDERERTNKAYNLNLVDYSNSTNDFWQMPIIANDNFVPDDLIGFNYAKSSDNKAVGIHFFLDDYQFERIWNNPEKYVDVLKKYDCILSPDFSLYMDMPMPMKIWNIYRSRQIGAYFQSQGIKVIPTISWSEDDTFAFCFLGIPEGSVVAISTIGVKEAEEALDVWKRGMDEMIMRIRPSMILVYGGCEWKKAGTLSKLMIKHIIHIMKCVMI